MEIRLRQGARTLGVTLTPESNPLEAHVDGRAHRLHQVSAHRVRTADGAEAADLSVVVDGQVRRAIVVRTGDRLLVSLDGRVHAFALGDETRHGAAATGGGFTTAPMPGKVVRVLVSVGDAVDAGDPLVVLEAMKMEMTLRAEIGGTVATVGAGAGRMVEAGAVLVEIAPPA